MLGAPIKNPRHVAVAGVLNFQTISWLMPASDQKLCIMPMPK